MMNSKIDQLIRLYFAISVIDHNHYILVYNNYRIRVFNQLSNKKNIKTHQNDFLQ